MVLYGSHGVTRTVLCSATFPQNAGALGMQQLGLGAGGTFRGLGLYSVFFFFKEACFFLGGSKLGYLKEMADVGIGQVDFFFLEYSGV